MWCQCATSGRCFMPPAPEVMAGLYAEYLQQGKPFGLTFRQYLEVIGFTDVAGERLGMDDGAQLLAAAPASGGPGPEMIRIPSRAIRGTLQVKVLLVDFTDRPGTLDPSHYESMLFSKGSYPTGSMRDFYAEVSLGQVDVTGTVHGWLRMPQPYSHYTNGQSGTGLTYPRNAQGLAEDAVRAALAAGVAFEPSLDALGQGAITALFIVHAGVGAEQQSQAAARANNIWSHKWAMRNPVQAGPGLQAAVYLTVPHDARIGVCAHELGHLAFQWEDFYDPNYDQDGSEWDGSGSWDLMAGGSWNGGGLVPAHPAALHKIQHGWVEVEEVDVSTPLALAPYTATSGKVVRIVSAQYRAGQYLLLENRTRAGFDSALPGEGLLVWRVDEARDMFKPDRPALMLVQADGRHDLERTDDWNTGDAGDPFPGAAGRDALDDQGDLSTTFPDGNASGIVLRNIARDPATGRITLDAAFAGEAPPAEDGAVVRGAADPAQAIPDSPAPGIESAIVLAGAGSAQEIAVEIHVDHSYLGDLQVTLMAPSGRSAVLHDRAGGSGSNLRAVFRSADTPALAALAGERVAGAWRLAVSDLATADVGVLQHWAIAIATSQEPDALRVRSEPALAIPDQDPAGVADTVEVTRGGVARTIAVEVDITHPYVRDLRVELVAPGGASALLHARTGGDGDDIRQTYTTAGTPSLGALVGTAVRGAWALRVADLARRDVGTLDAWALEVGLGGDATSERHETAPDLAVPDNNPAGVGSALDFTGAGTVQVIELAATIEHPYVGDLHIELVAPSGARAVLRHLAGGRGRDLDLALDSATSAPLAALVGQPAAGSWVLRIADLASADVGVLRKWSLQLSYA